MILDANEQTAATRVYNRTNNRIGDESRRETKLAYQDIYSSWQTKDEKLSAPVEAADASKTFFFCSSFPVRIKRPNSLEPGRSLLSRLRAGPTGERGERANQDRAHKGQKRREPGWTPNRRRKTLRYDRTRHRARQADSCPSIWQSGPKSDCAGI